MYRCHLRFYCIGYPQEAFEVIREMPPLANFTHSFSISGEVEPERLAEADVIVASLQGKDVPTLLRALAQHKKAETILLAERDQVQPLLGLLGEDVTDIWTLPMQAEEVRFRFRRWQENCRVQKELWQTGQFLEAAINSVPNLVWYKDKNGIHEKVNDSFCRTVGKTKEQVQGRGHAYIWDVEQDDPACIASEQEVMERRETCVSEETIQTGEGLRLLTTYKSPLYDWDGSVMGTVGVAIDVTQERAYEQEIITKNRTLETLFTTMDCGVMCHSVDGNRILSVNRAALEILGYDSQEEMLQDGFFMVAESVEDEDKERLRESIASLQKVGENVSVEYRVRHKDGNVIHVMGNVKLMEENGEMFYQRFLLDCTAQKLQEAKIRAESERHQAELIYALSMDYSVVCYFDLDTTIGMPLRLSEEDEQMKAVFAKGASFTECMEGYVRTAVHEDDREMMLRDFSLERLERELAVRPIYYINYRACVDGEIKYHQMKAVRAGEWEARRGMVIGFRNVDEETRREMEKKVLLEGALSQAKRASRAKSTFLSNMSHDIRTPMNAIVGFTSLAITHIDRRDQVEEYLKKIMTSGNHLLSLINDILDMSRIESGKIHLDEELCSLPEILRSLHSMIQTDIHAKQLDLYIDAVDVVDEEIFCDKLRLNQVLLNLVSNSIKYTGAGGSVTIRITERAGAPAGYASYEFLVKDTGIGMSQEFVSHIFEPFERERNSTISGIQGTGLGMAITKNIVDMMNGTIEVHSEQGVGTEFLVSFIFRLPTANKEAQVIPELVDCRALVVDDDYNTCDSVSYMLQQIGLRAEWTLSGKEAVLRTRQAVARKDTYGVYIIDWLIPDMNGVEVARRIRKEAGEDVPIIILTAYDWSEIEEEAREAGVAAFCSKPLFLSELHKCLRAIASAEETAQAEDIQRRQELHTGRILLVEDNKLNQEIAVALLEEAGFTTEVAENGQEAVEVLRKTEAGYYRLVLMDVQMPVMGGYEATQQIRQLEDKAVANIPILAMTANAFEEDRQAALRCGMNGHVAKPIEIDKLLEMMEQVLTRAESRPS